MTSRTISDSTYKYYIHDMDTIYLSIVWIFYIKDWGTQALFSCSITWNIYKISLFLILNGKFRLDFINRSLFNSFKASNIGIVPTLINMFFPHSFSRDDMLIIYIHITHIYIYIYIYEIWSYQYRRVNIFRFSLSYMQ